MNARKVLLLGVPAAGVLLLAGVLIARRPGSPEAGKKPAPANNAPTAALNAPAKVPAAPAPAPASVIAVSTDRVKVRGTYQNYRRAVATSDKGLEAVLLPALRRDRETARQFAEEDLARAGTDLDRQIAQKVMEALRP